jgi:hypothetical protein
VKINSKFKVILSLLITGSLFTAKKTLAACPVCTIAVGSALVLLEKYGVDNTITGLWIGGFMLSSSLWAINSMKKKEWDFRGIEPIILIFFYGSLIVPLYMEKIIGLPSKMLWGVDKTLLGIFIGSIFFHLGYLTYLKIKEKNGGKPWFPFQRVVMPISPLIILSIVFYFITRMPN